VNSARIESIRAAFEHSSAARLEHVRKVVELSLGRCEPGRPAAPDLRRALQALEQRSTFSPAARAAFHDLLARLGVPTELPIGLPLNDEPFWLRGGQPLANYQSRPALPASAEVVVIGAGLTGASAAYHLATAPAGKRPRRFVLIDKGDPAGEASGRNGGSFQLIPENSVGVYRGIAHERTAFLQRRYGGVPSRVLRAEGARQAALVMGLARRNRDALWDIIQRENIDCDFYPRGWLHLAHSEAAEQVICEEASFAAQHRHHFEIWPRRKILEEVGMKSDFLARFVPDDGTYHPFKYVCGLLGVALTAGVELYTRTRVGAVESVSADAHRVVTERGTIVARRVIVATNAFTAELFPALGAIRPRQSQVMVTEHAPDRTHGLVVTTEDGPAFFSQPRDGARDGRAPLLLGGGKDRPMENPSSRRRSPHVHALLLRLRDRFFPELHGQPPSAEWVGPMAFTPDQLPVIGFLRPGVIVAAGFNGYGGSYTTAAGQAAAHMARTGTAPAWVPADVFSPRRLLVHQPLFMGDPDRLWHTAASL
jgi:glycine/D-amino acid oxidase-like deaminating enzyme